MRYVSLAIRQPKMETLKQKRSEKHTGHSQGPEREREWVQCKYRPAHRMVTIIIIIRK